VRADKNKVLRLLKTAGGQVNGIINMVEQDQYCIDIANQILAVQSILKRINQEIFKTHMEGCVMEAFQSNDPAIKSQKIEEITVMMDKLTKQ
jgi:DNA-binding FrmR family transcriptional regulator